MNTTPRLRIFAGPNGSGKSTIKEVIAPALLGIYVNPDEIEKALNEYGLLDFSPYQVAIEPNEIIAFFTASPLLAKAHLLSGLTKISCVGNTLYFPATEVNSYWASVIADFIRQKLLENGISFTFETVMSSPDKVDFLRKAQTKGFRTYLYYVATEDPENINIHNLSLTNSSAYLQQHWRIVSRSRCKLNAQFVCIKRSSVTFKSITSTPITTKGP